MPSRPQRQVRLKEGGRVGVKAGAKRQLANAMGKAKSWRGVKQGVK